MRSDILKMLNDQVLLSVEVFFPNDVGIFQDDNPKIPGDQIVKEWFRGDETSFHGCATRVQTSTPLRFFGMCWRGFAQWSDPAMQRWMEINL